MNSSFKDLGITPLILKGLDEMGFEVATEVQSRTIPHILKSEDLIVRSKTGSGKTAAFGIPMLQMLELEAEGPQALILAPTRELAVQVDSDLKLMSKHMGIKTVAVYGQHSLNVEIEALQKGATVVSGTPGRVFDHIRQGTLNTKHIKYLVLDEADRMLDMGFIDQVVRIIKKLPQNRVTLLFSATMPSEIQKICREYMKTPVTIEIESETKTVDAIHQIYYRVEGNEKRTQLNRILMNEHPASCLIFCNTRAAVDRVQEYLARKGYSALALHGDIPQGRRLRTIQQFKNAESLLLVATDVAARGLHVEDLSLVINYDVPGEKDSYVHRIGRTGRAGNGGRAITMVTSEDIMSLYEIEEHIGAIIHEEDLPTDADLAASRPETEIWIASQAHKHKPSASAMAAGADSSDMPKRPARRKPEPRTGQHGTSRPTQSVKEKVAVDHVEKQRERKPHPTTAQVHPNRAEHSERPVRTDRPVRTERPERAAHTPRVPHTPRPHQGDRKPSSKTGKEPQKALRIYIPGESPSTPEKVPFVKRVIQRLFGKA